MGTGILPATSSSFYYTNRNGYRVDIGSANSFSTVAGPTAHREGLRGEHGEYPRVGGGSSEVARSIADVFEEATAKISHGGEKVTKRELQQAVRAAKASSLDEDKKAELATRFAAAASARGVTEAAAREFDRLDGRLGLRAAAAEKAIPPDVRLSTIEAFKAGGEFRIPGGWRVGFPDDLPETSAGGYLDVKVSSTPDGQKVAQIGTWVFDLEEPEPGKLVGRARGAKQLKDYAGRPFEIPYRDRIYFELTQTERGLDFVFHKKKSADSVEAEEFFKTTMGVFPKPAQDEVGLPEKLSVPALLRSGFYPEPITYRGTVRTDRFSGTNYYANCEYQRYINANGEYINVLTRGAKHYFSSSTVFIPPLNP